MSDDFDAYDLSEFTKDDLAAIDAELARAHGGPDIQIAIEDSPRRKFLSWKKHIAVTDLVGPLWCEVQYEYSLYGQRHKPLHARPSAFTSRNGKQIHVHQPVARTNDQTLRRGKSVHRALEDELRPEKLIIHVVSEEERFGLRLVQLMDGFSQLVSNGITRELPVFTITHTQVVLGVIDEVLWLPVTQPDRDQVVSPESPPLGSPQMTPSDSADLYELRIIDYKTRRSSYIPSDEDSLSSRLQLMMYHRMLSSLLEPEAFDFDLLWGRLNLDPTKPLSPQFLRDTLGEQRQDDPTDCSVHLNRLVSEWISTVQRNRTGLTGVSQQLHIVYRRSIYARKRDRGEHRATETVDIDDLELQEGLDLAQAIEESLGTSGHLPMTQVAYHVNQADSSVGHTSTTWKDPASPSSSEQTDPALAWAIQESLQVHTQVSADVVDDDPTQPVANALKAQVQEETTLCISPVIGQREFRMNDEELDAHIADVLQWWSGARPARGVDVGQTYRCFTCEYQDSCEWREQKSREALGQHHR